MIEKVQLINEKWEESLLYHYTDKTIDVAEFFKYLKYTENIDIDLNLNLISISKEKLKSKIKLDDWLEIQLSDIKQILQIKDDWNYKLFFAENNNYFISILWETYA